MEPNRQVEAPNPTRGRPSGRRVFLIALTMLLSAAVLFLGGIYLLSTKYIGDVRRGTGALCWYPGG
jgi:hypothetical protein